MPGLHQMGQTLGIVKVPDTRIDGAQLLQRLCVHRRRQPAQNKKDEYFDVQFTVNESEIVHKNTPPF
jgi:hypothetical protein